MIAIHSAERRRTSLHIEVCPAYEDVCTCEDPKLAHPHYDFAAQPVEDAEDQPAPAPAEWAARCADEALRLAAAAQPASPEPLPELVGRTVSAD